MKKIFTLAVVCLALMLFTVNAFADEATLAPVYTEPLPVSTQEVVPAATEASVAEYGAEADTKQEWQIYLEEKVIPAAIFVITSAGSVLLMLAPAIKAAKKTICSVKEASDAVSSDKKTATAQQAEFAERVEAFFAEQQQRDAERNAILEKLQKDNQEYRQALSDTEARLALSIQRCNANAERTRRMAYLAFTNNKELVQKGIAPRIAEVDNEDKV